MDTNSEALFEAFLNQHDEEVWSCTVLSLLASIHEVDRAATQIWFAFYPLGLARALQEAEDPEALAHDLVLQGRYFLKEQIDSSHRFLYGHRYWPEVKKAVVEYAASTKAPRSLDLVTLIREVASTVAGRIKVDESLLIGITAVAFMTLEQVGAAAFKAAPGIVRVGPEFAKRSADQVVAERTRDDRQGLFGFLQGPWRRFSVTFDENEKQARFRLIETQHLTTAAATDKRDYTSRDSRCVKNEGPIPVQCRSASCGTCWVGVLAGADKLSEVGDLEGRRIKEFGYIDTGEPRPLIRLACQAQGHGNVTIVIPPWNGVFGKFLRKQKETARAQQAPSR